MCRPRVGRRDTNPCGQADFDVFGKHDVNIFGGSAARSSDMNIFENVSSTSTHVVYKNDRQFNNKAELKAAIEVAWQNSPQAEIRSLYEGFLHRIIALHVPKGKHNESKIIISINLF